MPAIRTVTEADLPSLVALTEDRGWFYPEHRWSFLLGTSEAFGVDGEHGDLAGVVLLTRYEPKLAAIGTMLVHSRYGRQGLGTALMRHVLDQAGDATVFLYATPYGRPLYARLGFRTTGTVYSYTGRFAPEDVPAGSRVAGPG
ncbi:GNAT family N-acetyltransferase, partial [Amycolatopsis rhizosphaerae]